MLNSVPKQIVLTLQSSPPFLLEIILAITIALLLAIPLVTRLQYFLGYTEEPLISFSFLNPRRRQISSSTSGSNESLTLFPVRHVNSSPNFKNSYLTESDIINGSSFTMDISSSYNHNTDYPFSVAYDYGYYRHKLIESNLKRHYGSQPPGNVVLNSLHLSSIDSTTGLRLSEKYKHSIFELAPNSNDHNQERDQLITLIHPRDHFLRKGSRRYESADKSTETLFISNVSQNLKEEEESELKEKIASLPRRKTRIKKDKSSSDNVKVFKVKIDSFDNPRPVSPFKNREIYEIPEVKSEITENRAEIYDLESKFLDKKEETNEIVKSRPGSPVKKIKERKSKIKMNLKVKEKLSEVRDKKYDSLIIDGHKNKEGENFKPEEEIEVNKKISSATVELNSPKNNFTEENVDDKNISREEDKLCGESENNLDCKFKEEIKAEAEKCLAKMSDVLALKSYGSSRGEVRVEKRSRPNTSSGVLSRAFKHLSPKVNSRPRSSGGGFAWEVPDISGKVWSDDNEEKTNRSKDESKKPGTPTGLKRPRSANPQFFRKKSDPVLPVLESIIDLTYDVPLDLLDEECLVGGKEDQNRPLELKHPVGFDENQSDSGTGSRDRKGKSKIKGGKKVKSEKTSQGAQDSLLQKKPFLRSRSGRYSVLKVTKFKSKK